MSTGEITITLHVNVALFQAWLSFLKVLLGLRLISGEQGRDLAMAGTNLILIKIGDHPFRGWQRFKP